MTLHSNKVKAKIIKSTFACQRDGLTIRGTEYRPEGTACRSLLLVTVLWLFRIQSASMRLSWRKWDMFHTALIFAAGV